LLASSLTAAIVAAARTSRGAAAIAGSLDNVWVRSTIDEGSTTVRLHVGGDGTLTEDRGEVALSNIIYLFDARSAKVGAVDGTSLAGSNCRDDLKETVKSQGTASRLNACESLGDAELVVIRSIGKANALPDGGVNLLYDGGERTGLGVAEGRLEVRCATSGNVGDDVSDVVIGARTARAKAL
jgi:hypothetical protein